MRIALIEPYYGGSHKVWADGYAATSGHEVTLITHGARFWKWRMQGGFLTLAEQLAADIEANGVPDAILASSMMNVASFAGAVRGTAPGVPIAVYFHESQFTYPLSSSDRVDLTYPMKNWSSAAISDLVIFNSDYHRTVFGDEARRFLNAFPEDKHVHRVGDVIDAAIVLPVGVPTQPLIASRRAPGDPPLIVWNHRWEHDKGPSELREIVTGLIATGLDFSMAMCGEVFVSVPEEFGDVVDLLGDRLVHKGWADRNDYLDLLLSADVALSTAHQEFFGIGVVEAIAAGAHPVLPHRLVYPERITELGGDPSHFLYDDADQAVQCITAAVVKPDASMRQRTAQYDWETVSPRYDDALSALIERG
ncbi:MAG: tRNA-queuosine alpha-mannosyltransferase domain-containing protein [Acidimicrobiia bacterium]